MPKIKCRYNAFTLAEVLITLGIIGIVASMTIPTLINKYQEKVTVTRVKKFYSMMSQALQFAIAENGPVDTWSYTSNGQYDEESSKEFTNYFKKYLKVSKDCANESGCIANSRVKYLHGQDTWSNYDTDKHYKMILMDGSYLWIRNNYIGCTTADGEKPNVCGLMWLDVNGKSEPNTFGKDIFVFHIMKNRIEPKIEDDCNLNSQGWGCSKYILTHDNMDYLHEQ